MGFLETKIRLNRDVPLAVWNFLKNKKSVGILNNDKEAHVVTLAKPMGIIACVTPTTNTSTPIHNAMTALKGRNVVVFCAHPRAVNNCKHMVELMREEIEKLGFPADMIQVAEPCSLEMTDAIMKRASAIVATGGESMVRAAYSSGRPSFGVGQGNAQCIMHPSYTDYATMANNILTNRTGDNGVPCIGEQCLFVPRTAVDQVVDAFRNLGAYIVEKPEEIDMLRKITFVNGQINRAIVGQLPCDVARIAGFEVPQETKILIVRMGEQYGRQEPLCREIMCPMTRLFTYNKFEDAVTMARANLLIEGAGHSSTVYSLDEKAVEYCADQLPVCRVLVNMRNGGASGISFSNGLEPTNSIGCGSWGGNSISENLTYRHLINLTKVAYPIPSPHIPTPEEVWGE